MATMFCSKILILLSALAFGVLTLPLEPLPGKSGEDQVKEAVHKAELAARKAALESEKNGNSAELRVAAIKAKLAAQHAVKENMEKIRKLHPKLKPISKWAHTSRLHHKLKSFSDSPRPDEFSTTLHHGFRRPRHRNGYSNMISLNDLASDTGAQTNYQEDTTLEDRLALEAEEDKKYGGVSYNDDYSSSRSSLSNQDATQSIQNQVASESARELKEIQQQISAESQNSLGKTTIGQAGAMFQGNPSRQPQRQQKPVLRNGMMDVQADLNSALSNAEGMNADSNIASPQINGNAENNIGTNAFTGLGEEKQQEDIGMNMPGVSSMANEEMPQAEPIGGGQATMEGPQDTAQSATSALAAGAGQAAFSNSQPDIPNDIGGLRGMGGATENAEPGEPQGIPGLDGGAPGGSNFGGNNLGGNNLGGNNLVGNNLGGNNFGGGEMLSGGNMEGNSFGGNDMKKSRINERRRLPKKQ